MVLSRNILAGGFDPTTGCSTPFGISGSFTFLLTFVPAGKADAFDTARESSTFRTIASLNALRGKLPALVHGEINSIWCDSQGDSADDGVFAFARYVPGAGEEPPREAVIVVINASTQTRRTRAKEHRMKLVSSSGQPLFREGDLLEAVPIAGFTTPEIPAACAWRNGIPEIELTIPPETIAIFRVK